MTNQESNGDLLRAPEHGARGATGGGVDARHVWIVLRERYRLVLLVGASLFTLVMGFTLLSGMQFQSSGRLYLGELDGKKKQVSSEDFLDGGQGDVYSEIEIIRSRSRVQQAILASGLNVTMAPAGWAPPQYWRWLLSRRDLSLLDVTAPEVSATQASPTSRTQETVSLTVRISDDGEYTAFTREGTLLGQGRLGEPAVLGQVVLTLSPGIERSPKPGAQYDLEVRPIEPTVEDALRDLQVSAAKVPTAVEPVKVLNLEFTSASPNKAAAFLQHLMQVYLVERQMWKTEDATAAEAFVTKQLASMKRSLGASEAKLADFRSRHSAVIQESQAEAVVDQLTEYEQQRTSARLQVSALRAIQQALEQPRPAIESYLIGEVEDSVLNGLAGELLESQQRLIEFESRLYEGAIEVVQQRAKLATQLKLLRNYVAGRLTRAQEQVRSLDAVIGQSERKLKTVPGAELGLAKIGRESEVYSRVYSYLLERQQQTQILKASTVSKNRIIDMPQVPVREHSPKLALRFASGLLGLLLGAIVVILQSLSSSALRTESDVRTALGGAAIFASVPARSRTARSARGARARAIPIFDLFAGPDRVGFAEAFRTLRTNLYYIQPVDQGAVVLVTSPAPGDGKTTTVLCLATILAADGKRVLVIDADLRKPSHHQLTGHRPDPGLRGLLGGKCSEAAAKNVVHVTCGSFDSIPAGLGAPAELLSTPRLGELLARMRHDYDYILVDSPSYPLVSDALMLARQSDFVLSVIRLGNTRRHVAEAHVSGLGAKARGHAIVINNSDVTQVYGYPEYARPRAAIEERSTPPGASDPPDVDSDPSELRIQ